jgi:hypothetical protein
MKFNKLTVFIVSALSLITGSTFFPFVQQFIAAHLAPLVATHPGITVALIALAKIVLAILNPADRSKATTFTSAP